MLSSYYCSLIFIQMSVVIFVVTNITCLPKKDQINKAFNNNTNGHDCIRYGMFNLQKNMNEVSKKRNKYAYGFFIELKSKLRAGSVIAPINFYGPTESEKLLDEENGKKFLDAEISRQNNYLVKFFGESELDAVKNAYENHIVIEEDKTTDREFYLYMVHIRHNFGTEGNVPTPDSYCGSLK